VKWLKDFYNLCTQLAQNKWAMPFLGVFSFFESIFIPLPVDPLVMAVCASRPKASFKALIWTVLGSLSGASAGYLLGLYFAEGMQTFLMHYFLSADQWTLLLNSYSKGAFLFVFIGGFTPLPFKVFAISAGLLNGAFLPFILGAALGRTLRFGIIATLFYFYGSEIKSWMDKNFEKLVLIITLVIFLGLGFYLTVKHFYSV
jgi:membrane protein YqaA with SNARE-associated domain